MAVKDTVAEDHHHWPEGTGMIYLGMSPWDGMWKNRHQLMSRFARQMPVLYVEPPQRLRKLRRRFFSGNAPLSEAQSLEYREIDANLYVYGSHSKYPVSGARFLRRITEFRWHRAISRAARELGIDRPILWISLPEQSRALGNINNVISIYHVVDEYAGYTGQQHKRAEKLFADEQFVLDRVDLTIAVSPELVRGKSGINRDVRLVENAVDLRQFNLARSRNKKPADLERIPSPRLGYCGLIGKRLNLKLVLELARRNPEWSLVFIGKVDSRDCEAEILALHDRRNVYFLGEQEPRAVADYVAGLDIGLLPYELNVETNHISPLKMYEYLAVGIPVIATAIPAALRHSDLLEIAENVDEFESKSRLALSDRSGKSQDARISFARKNTWENRIDQLTEMISSALWEKNKTPKSSG